MMSIWNDRWNFGKLLWQILLDVTTWFRPELSWWTKAYSFLPLWHQVALAIAIWSGIIMSLYYPPPIGQRSHNLCHLYPGIGLQLGGFPMIKIILICRLHVCCSLSVMHAKKRHTTCEDHGCTLFAFISVGAVCTNLNTPTKMSVADDAILHRQYTSSGISFLYLWPLP